MAAIHYSLLILVVACSWTFADDMQNAANSAMSDSSSSTAISDIWKKIKGIANEIYKLVLLEGSLDQFISSIGSLIEADVKTMNTIPVAGTLLKSIGQLLAKFPVIGARLEAMGFGKAFKGVFTE
ncbi:uncharacterized protein LOC109595257 isoform X1 [Aethina tumida]|uniref:uncharacterized protein LOC109595257 isoform X1 n=1 Tax=Aethina tumida TaxID=116153 RepID=UPI00096AE90B|nr:uncharacterized protein LOC109595257 isoform X1 [Aethina tumida]